MFSRNSCSHDPQILGPNQDVNTSTVLIWKSMPCFGMTVDEVNHGGSVATLLGALLYSSS
jgi:hypothetical protein